MMLQSYRSKLGKEFRAAFEGVGLKNPGLGISGTLLLHSMKEKPVPLASGFDGRNRAIPPEGMGMLVKMHLAKFDPVPRDYQITAEGRKLLTAMLAAGLVALAMKFSEQLAAFKEGES